MSRPVSDDVAQVLGVAYTYEVSQVTRRELTSRDPGHSSRTDSFSFFVKCRLDEAVPHGGTLRLRPDAPPGEPVPHWPEAELAARPRPRPPVDAYTPANHPAAPPLGARGRGRRRPTPPPGTGAPGRSGPGPALHP